MLNLFFADFGMIFLLSMIPETLVHMALGMGIVTLIISSVLQINRFYTVALALFVGLVMFLEGATWTGREYAAQLNKAKEEIAALEQKQEELSQQLASKFTGDRDAIRQTGNTILESVNEVVTPSVDNQCSIPSDVRVLHDSAAKNEVPRTTRGSNGETETAGEAPPRLSELTGTVVQNYSSCNEIKAQLEAMQKWVREMQRAHDGN